MNVILNVLPALIPIQNIAINAFLENTENKLPAAYVFKDTMITMVKVSSVKNAPNIAKIGIFILISYNIV